ncbi:MAG: spermidine synthase, partial [Planctomycetota bacterium]
NEVCQDVAVIPFLWVVPLSLYLLSFILCFESDRWYHRRFFSVTTAGLVLAVCWLQSFGTKTHLPLQLLIYFGYLFCICMLCHGELARLRPSADRLTAFYLTLSAGGAAGGLFVGLVAPAVFPAFWEHDLGLMVAGLIAMVVLLDSIGSSDQRRPSILIASPFIALLVATGTVFATAVTDYTESTAMSRNFYGVLEVEHDEIEDATVLRHGRILHGLQLRTNPRLPTMYYGYGTGIGLAITELREHHPTLRIGLVGLGAGTLAAYGRPDDNFRFYEINDTVTEFAKTHFTFLSDSSAKIDIVPGDARLVLEREVEQQFDLLVLDAFSGDAIPTHLLTTEAMQVYLRHLRKDGLLAFHISNLHFDLRRVTESLASDANLSAITLETQPAIDPRTGAALISDPGSRWVLMSRDGSMLEKSRYQNTKIKESVSALKRVRWTDDFSNLIEVMYR